MPEFEKSTNNSEPWRTRDIGTVSLGGALCQLHGYRDQRPHLVLIAEDDPDDRTLFEEGIRQSDYNVECRFVKDGVEVVGYLREEANPKPRLIFVDLRMPRMGAIELIPHLKSDPRMDTIPVLVFTGSNSEEEVRKVEGFAMHGMDTEGLRHG